MAFKLLPNSSIDGANQAKEVWASKLNTSFLKYAPPAIGATSKEWYGRSGREFLEQWRRIHKACARLQSCYLQVVEQRLTGDIEDDQLLRIALARYNKSVDPSNVYDVLRNKKYPVGAKFTFTNCYGWLLGNSDWLDPADAFCNTSHAISLADDERASVFVVETVDSGHVERSSENVAAVPIPEDILADRDLPLATRTYSQTRVRPEGCKSAKGRAECGTQLQTDQKIWRQSSL
jgi:hypothetical protein